MEDISAKQAELEELLTKGISTEDDQAKFKGLLGSIETLKSAVGAKDALDTMRNIVGDPTAGLPQSKTLAEEVFGSVGFKSVLKHGGGRVDVPSLGRAAFGIKAPPSLVSTATPGAGAELLTEQNLGITVLPEFALPTILNLITRGVSNSDTIKWVEMAFKNNAAVVDQATSANNSGASGGLKPDSFNEFKERVATSQTIAHLKYVTRQALANRSYLMGLIENEMVSGLAEKAEELLFTDPDYGLLNASGVQSQGFDTDINKTILMARSLVIAEKATPQAILINPVDAVNVYSATDTGGWFYNGGPVEAPTPRLWGIPIVETVLCPEGTAFIGDFKSVHLDVVEPERFDATDSHLDFFARNIEAVRAETTVIIRTERPERIVMAALS